MNEILKHFQSLVELVKTLRSEDGCPWDREQTQSSLARFAIEEAYELADSIHDQDQEAIQEELGDFLFQVIIQAQVAEDEGFFTLNKVISQLNEKMIRRHPHVFAKKSNLTSQQVLKNWDEIKKQEKTTQSKPLFSYPKNLPALMTSNKIGEKTHSLQFDWNQPLEVVEKVKEELEESIQAIKNNDKKEMEAEIGDLLFSVAQLARHCQLDPELCLRAANQRFTLRFQQMLGFTNNDPSQFKSLPLNEKEKLWKKVKSKATP